MLDWNCREKRSQALPRCNLARDISVDGTPIVLPVPGEHRFVGDSFLEDRSILEPCLKKPSARLSAHHLSLSHNYLELTCLNSVIVAWSV